MRPPGSNAAPDPAAESLIRQLGRAVRRVRSAVQQHLSQQGGSKAACVATLLLAWTLLAASLQGRGLMLRALCTLGMLLWSAAFLRVMGQDGLLQLQEQPSAPPRPHTPSPFEQSAASDPMPIMSLALLSLLVKACLLLCQGHTPREALSIAGALRDTPIISDSKSTWQIKLVDMDIVDEDWQGELPGPLLCCSSMYVCRSTKCNTCMHATTSAWMRLSCSCSNLKGAGRLIVFIVSCQHAGP